MTDTASPRAPSTSGRSSTRRPARSSRRSTRPRRSCRTASAACAAATSTVGRGNPTRTSLETLLASLEGGVRALSFASGLAAEDALLRAVLRPGDHVVLGNDVYGGTHRLIDRIHGEWGIRNTTVDLADLDAVRTALGTERHPHAVDRDAQQPADEDQRHRGPRRARARRRRARRRRQHLRLAGAAAAAVARRGRGRALDHEVPGRPLRRDRRRPRLRRTRSSPQKAQFIQFAAGAVSSPMDAWLTMRGIKTLAVRMRRHTENAQAIAEALVGHAGVDDGLLPRPARPPRPRARGSPDERLRRDAVGRARRRSARPPAGSPSRPRCSSWRSRSAASSR